MIPPIIAITVPPTPLTSLVAVLPIPEEVDEDGTGAGAGAGAGAGGGADGFDPNKLNALPIYV